MARNDTEIPYYILFLLQWVEGKEEGVGIKENKRDAWKTVVNITTKILTLLQFTDLAQFLIL